MAKHPPDAWRFQRLMELLWNVKSATRWPKSNLQGISIPNLSVVPLYFAVSLMTPSQSGSGGITL